MTSRGGSSNMVSAFCNMKAPVSNVIFSLSSPFKTHFINKHNLQPPAPV